jgi:hypothetical protein
MRGLRTYQNAPLGSGTYARERAQPMHGVDSRLLSAVPLDHFEEDDSMSDQNSVTLGWISESTGELVEWPVPTHVAEALDRGQG